MNKICVFLCVFMMAVGSVSAGPIKGLVDIGTGMEIPDADLRYFTQAALSNQTVGVEGFKLIGAWGHDLEHLMADSMVEGISRHEGDWTYTEGFLPFPSLVVSWESSHINDPKNSRHVIIDAGTNTLTDFAMNWAYWDSATPNTMQFSTGSRPFATNKIVMGWFSCSFGGIMEAQIERPAGDLVLTMDNAHANAMPSLVTEGLTFSASGTAPSNIIMSAGVEFHDMERKNEYAADDLSNPAVTFGLLAYHHTNSSTWGFTSTNALPLGVWDNGTNMVAADSSKYYRGLFVIVGDSPFMSWVVPQVEYTNLVAAQEGEDPSLPPGWEPYMPYCTAYIYKGDDTLLNTSSDYWLDRRFMIRRGTLTTGGGGATPTLNEVLVAGAGTGGILPTGMGMPTASDESASKGYVDQEISSVMDWVTSSNITMDAGTEWTFSLANVTNDATAGIEIVNWQTMTNYVALNPADPPVTNNTTEVFNQMVTFPSITVAGQLIDGSVSTISVANVSLDVDWLPTATVDIGSEGLPLDALYVNDATSGKQAVNWQTMTGYADSIQTNQEAVAFSASSEEDWAHTNLAYDAFDVVRGRLWVSDTNNSPVDVTATLSLYMDSDRHGEDVIYRADFDCSYEYDNGR